MTDIITFMNAGSVQSVLEATNQLVSGMTVSEAIAATGAVVRGGIATFNVIKGGLAAGASVAGSASDALIAFQAAGGVFSSSGAATVAGAETANFAIASSAGVTGAVGVLSMSVPTILAVASPLIGVGIGYGLYSLAPEFWTEVSQALLPWCYPDTNVIPGVVNENNQVYIPSGAVEAVKNTIDSFLGTEGTTSPIKPEWVSGNINNGIASYSAGSHVHSYEVKNGTATIVHLYYSDPETHPFDYIPTFILASRSRNLQLVYDGTETTEAYQESYTYDSKTVYWIGESISKSGGYVPKTSHTVGYCEDSDDFGKVAWTMIYGTPGRDYSRVPGSYEWGNPVDYTDGAINVATSAGGLTYPYYPVYIPYGDPGYSVDPDVQPDPQAPTVPEEIPNIIPPVVSPNQYPEELPEGSPGTEQRTSPQPNPATTSEPSLNPDADPSAQPQTEPEPAPEPPTPPSSSGDSDVDPFPPADFPTINKTGSGLIHVYRLTTQEMINFGKWLWVTYQDATIEKIWANPFDGVISAHEIYTTPEISGTDNIRSGFLVSTVTGGLVNPRYKTINCGSVVVPEAYGNYLDYAPYTKCHVYLPFIGIVELTADDVIGHAVNIKYIVDAYNGSCIAQVVVAKTEYECLMFQYSGNCSVEVPLAGGSQAAIKAGLISAAAGGITSAITGVITGGTAGAIAGAALGFAGNLASAGLSNKASVQHSGSFGASYGAMGAKKPYIIVHRPIQKQVVNYNIEYGFPSHKRVVIGSCTGYLKAKEVHVVSPTASDEEKARIEEMLKSGVFVS